MLSWDHIYFSGFFGMSLPWFHLSTSKTRTVFFPSPDECVVCVWIQNINFHFKALLIYFVVLVSPTTANITEAVLKIKAIFLFPLHFLKKIAQILEWQYKNSNKMIGCVYVHRWTGLKLLKICIPFHKMKKKNIISIVFVVLHHTWNYMKTEERMKHWVSFLFIFPLFFITTCIL